MRMVMTLFRRNLTVFWRDRMTVFFSLLSPLILFTLFMLFYRETTSKLVMDSIPGTTQTEAYGLCDAWMFASVTTLATFSSSLGMLTAFVEDRVSGRFSDYLVSPIRRWQLTLGYVLSALLISSVISIALMSCGRLWAMALDQPTMSLSENLICIAAIVLACAIFSAYNTLAVTFTTTQGGFGGYSIIMGTSVGFLAFCYVPPASLSSGINSVLGVMPFAQSAALIRNPAMTPAIERLMDKIPDPAAQDIARETIMENLGVYLLVGDFRMGRWLMVGILILETAVLAALGALRMGRAMKG